MPKRTKRQKRYFGELIKYIDTFNRNYTKMTNHKFVGKEHAGNSNSENVRWVPQYLIAIAVKETTIGSKVDRKLR